MLLTLSTDQDADDVMGFLLHKHPDRFQSFDLSFGKAHVFYPRRDEDRTTACLMLDVDPIGMMRKSLGSRAEGYVNDRPYVASSFMSTAIAKVFGSAMAGRCKDRPDAVQRPMRWEVRIEALPVRGGEPLLRRIFEPLGYRVEADAHPLDPTFDDWGDSPYLSVRLVTVQTLQAVLQHLYVLIPVFDNQKHYFVGSEEIDKLLAKGRSWLADHPQREAITRRYLRNQSSMVRQAIDRLSPTPPNEATIARDDATHQADRAELAVEASVVIAQERCPTQKRDGTAEQGNFESEASVPPSRTPLNQLRYQAVIDVITQVEATSVVDLGCGEGKLMRQLIKQRSLRRIVGMDVSAHALQIAADRLRIDTLPPPQAERIELIQGSLMYRDSRLAGFDVAMLVEVIEHLDPPRLDAMRQVVFDHARPQTVIVTTPNVEYNAVWESLPAGKLRHTDHRFEWSRQEFARWTQTITERFGYSCRHAGIGAEIDGVGTPTQMAIFQRPGDAA